MHEVRTDDPWELRKDVAKWLRVFAENKQYPPTWQYGGVTEDQWRAVLRQLATDAERSELLPRLFSGGTVASRAHLEADDA